MIAPSCSGPYARPPAAFLAGASALTPHPRVQVVDPTTSCNASTMAACRGTWPSLVAGAKGVELPLTKAGKARVPWA
jgi:hypothetical protein